MKINERDYEVKGLNYSIRSAVAIDALPLSKVRLQIDGETENMDRESGEAYLDEEAFAHIIKADDEHSRKLFLVAEAEGSIIGFARCEGNDLKRTMHKVEFGVCLLKNFWGHGIGTNFLKESIAWSDSIGIKKIQLNVLETNTKAIGLYKSFGFEIEGILKHDKLLSDGNFYDTIVMGRLKH
ncbi:GNAT family N-acetyltransferase [Paenibacillus daejeonensis]|uniref:GNAT family N-acetyltransferase n=1 Tax=Paenibacillus daejeonensis TaxID=135193 RepID=UPI00036CF2C7|nr:GNAT family N-acetyltransferase [Paenibacillus daejeonensis]